MIDLAKVSSSLTSDRLPYLKQLKQQLSSELPPKNPNTKTSNESETIDTLSPEDKWLLLDACLNTYTNYQDPASRLEVSELLTTFVELQYAEEIIEFIYPLSPSLLAITDLLTLFNWINLVFLHGDISNLDSSVLDKALEAWTNLLNNCLDRSRLVENAKTSRIFHTVVANAKYTMSQVLSESLIDKFVKISPANPLNSFSIILALANDLQPTNPKLLAYILNLDVKTSISNKFVSEIVSKFPTSLPPAYTFELFNLFWEGLDQPNELISVLDNVDKLIMKNSEVTLTYLLPHIINGLPSSYYHTIIDHKIFPKILNGLKNSKDTIREKTFDLLITIQFSDISKLLDLSKTGNTDSKILIYKLIHRISQSSYDSSDKLSVLTNLLALLKKDFNENTSMFLIKTFVNYYFSLDTINKDYNDLLVSGMTNKKLNLRKLWYVSIAEYISTRDVKDLASIQEFKSIDLNKHLEVSIKEYVQSPLLMVSNKGISCVFIAAYLTSRFGLENQFISQLVDHDKFPVDSIGIFNKLSDSDDITWGFQLLSTLDNKIHDGYSWLHLLTNNEVPVQLRLNGIENHLGSISSSTVEIIYDTLLTYLTKPEDAPITINLTNLSKFLKKLIKINSSIKLMVISNYPLMKVKNDWIGLTQLVNLNVAEFLTTNFEQVWQLLVTDILNRQPIESHIAQSAVKSLGQVSFVIPDLIIPKLLSSFNEEVSIEKFEKIDDLALKFWENDSELPVVNVLKKSNLDLNKNSKDYDIKKWEMELKQSLKKVSKDDQKLINEQKQKELAVKDSINGLVHNLRKELAIVSELVDISRNFITNIDTWYPSVINMYMKLFPQFPLIDKLSKTEFSQCFVKLSGCIDNKFDSNFKNLIGLNILKLYEAQGDIDDQMILKILFRIKFLSDQVSNFGVVTLSYLYPLLIKLLSNNYHYAIKADKTVVTSEFVAEDPKDEQLYLCIEIFSSHADMFTNPTIPRLDVLAQLIQLIKLPSKLKISKDCFMAIGGNISLNYTYDDLLIFFRHLVTSELPLKVTILELLDHEFELDNILPQNYNSQLWICCHDNNEQVASLANTIWTENKLQVIESSAYEVMEQFLDQVDSGIRLSIGAAILDSINHYPQMLDEYLQFLFKFYDEKSRPPPPKLDEFGLVIKTSVIDRDFWEVRSTVALTLNMLVPLLKTSDQIETIFKFLIDEKALNDKNDLVRQELQDYGIEIISKFSLDKLEPLINIFESNLETVEEHTIKESIIILYGSLGQHLQPDDPRVNIILDRLISTLRTPSESVQVAISKCLASLVHLFKPDFVRVKMDELFQALFDEKNSVHIRKGAAYGISGLVKGLGIKALTEYDVIRNLNDSVDDKKNPIKRESTSLVYECLSSNLGHFFEPYVIEILPNILKLLGDQSPEVRLATDRAAKVIMSNTTSFGVKKLIPVAISNLDEIAWRSKKGSVELLGAMAYLDPAQLSSSLSIIVPEIVGVLNDTHKEVRKAADQALKRFGEVIRNPEIQRIVPDLIQAIGNPTKFTDNALDKLIKTQFVHYIDGPSLALIIHVIHRGMKDRSAQVKRKACQIVGNMAILVDTKDLRPYLSQLVQELELSMVDPVPSTRSTAARALGSLVEKLGEEQFPDLIPKLLNNLQDETKLGDRLGSAQALSEVVCGLGLNKLDELLPVILANAKSHKNYVRAGFMPLLLYLPVCFGSQFAPYLSKIIPPILSGLADTDEEIRDMALRSGRLIVKNYAKVAIDLLLPELEAGLNDTNYRIRLSSVELTGDLLFQVTGISGKNEMIQDEDDDVTGGNSGEINKSLVELLGINHRNQVLSLLFICRSDVNALVRNQSVEIWKALVSNTPRMVKEVLPTLTEIIIKKLASDDDAEKTIAASTLGEMVKRVGSNSLAQILPNLTKLLDSLDSNIKEGVCIALTELIKSTSEEGLIEYEDTFIDITYRTLTDENTNVRNAAAASFDVLQTSLGKKVIDDIIPKLLNMLESDDSEYALLALQDIMSTKSEIIFPILIPTLLSPPIDGFKIKALASLASVAGVALYRKLSLIINTLVDLIVSSPEEDQEDIKKALDTILVSINDQDGVNPLMQTLLLLTKHEDYRKRAIIFETLGHFFANTTLDYSIYLVDMVSGFILSLGDKSPEVVKGTFEALSALVKAQSKETLHKLVKPAQQSLVITGVKGEELSAFKLPRGPNCVLPIFLQGLMYGNNEQRELSAIGIADIIEKTASENLKPFSTTITGPLIRIIGEKVSSNIKASILFAINNLLIKIPQFLRPFIPQLQRTFVRLLNDPSNDELRNRSVVGLGILIKFQPRIDSLIIELISGCKNSSEEEIKLTMLKAILEIINRAGDKLNEQSKKNVLQLVEDEMLTVKGKISLQYAKLIGTLSKILTIEETQNILRDKILFKGDTRFSIIGINAFLKESNDKLVNLVDEIIEFIVNTTNDINDSFTTENCAIAIGKLLLCPLELSPDQQTALVHQLCKLINKPDLSADTKRLSIIVLRTVGRLKYSIIEANLHMVVLTIFNNVRSMIIPIKLAAEKCYVAVLNLTQTEDIFNNWIDKQPDNVTLEEFDLKFVKRSINDYTKRVAIRLAKVEVERIEQGGDDETLFSDRIEDESEIWSIGGL